MWLLLVLDVVVSVGCGCLCVICLLVFGVAVWDVVSVGWGC